MGNVFYLILLFTLISLYYLLYLQLFARKIHVKERLESVELEGNRLAKKKKLTFQQRVIEPIYNRIFEYLQRITPSGIRTEYNKLLNESGYGQKMTYTNLIIIQLLSVVISGLLIVNLVRIDNKFIVIIAAAILFFYLPVFLLRRQAQKRKDAILHALPSFLDLIYVTVEAGLSFDLALQNTLREIEGPISEEFKRTIDEIQHGRSRTDAFNALAKRTQVEELQNFLTSIILAEQLGSNIGNVLRVQSSTMRKNRKQRAEEKAAQIPIKMTIPLVFLMFPALFVVILGPAVINIIEQLF